MDVQQIMTSPAVTCRLTDTLNNAAKLMWEHDCGAVPVVSDDGRVVGIITDRDICMAAYTQGKPLSVMRVAGSMANQVTACQADDSVEVAERLMSDNQIRRLPVLDHDGRSIGILSLNDLARYAVSTGKTNGFAKAVTQTLAAICQPHARIRTRTTEVASPQLQSATL